jgi:hypothetical protein
MASFRRAGHEQVNVFEIDDTYLFKHYFDGEDVFDRLKPYYNNQEYRFEVQPDEFEEIREFLDEQGYGLVLVDALVEFVVVVRKYTDHPNIIFKESVVQRSVGNHNFFRTTDQKAVERAVSEGATRLTESDVENPF